MGAVTHHNDSSPLDILHVELYFEVHAARSHARGGLGSSAIVHGSLPIENRSVRLSIRLGEPGDLCAGVTSIVGPRNAAERPRVARRRYTLQSPINVNASISRIHHDSIHPK